MSIGAFTLTLISPIFAIIGIFLGNYLSYRNTEIFFYRRRSVELKERAYSRLLGIKVPFIQAMQTILEAKILTEFYETRYIRISNNLEDREEAKRQNSRFLELIHNFSVIQRELFELIGDIQISYESNEHLRECIDLILNYKQAVIREPDPSLINSQLDLDSWKETVTQHIEYYLNEELKKKINDLIPLLLLQIKEANKLSTR